MYEIGPKITKEFILQRKSQEDLWLHYFPVVDFNQLFRSPLRADRNVTCSMFIHKNGMLHMKDHNGSFSGDVFAAIGYNTAMNFQEVLDKVYNEVIKGQPCENVISIQNSTLIPKTKRIIRIKQREWEDYDLAYWEQYGFDKELLAYFNILPVSHVWLSHKVTGELELIFINHKNNPIYAYRFANFEYKIYLPFSKDIRFICNTSRWNGWDQLPKTGDLVFISKSLKDVGTLRSVGYYATSSQGEGMDLDPEKIEDLKQRFKQVIIWYDNDNAGRTNAEKNSEKFNLMWIEIPEEVGCKDPSDFHAEYGPQELVNLIENLIG